MMLKLGALLCGSAVLAGCGGNAPSSQPQLLEDQSFLAFVDDDGDGLSFDDSPRGLRLSDYYAQRRPGTKIIMLNAAAGWCGPCAHEASKLSELSAAYAARGVVVLTAVFQKADASAADQAFTRQWAETFALSIPTLVDSAFATQKYFEINALPANMFVNAESREILAIATGATPGDDPLVEYRDWLDQHLQN